MRDRRRAIVAWVVVAVLIVGYRGALAFAVLVEGGGTGANSAGPIANAFLRNL